MGFTTGQLDKLYQEEEDAGTKADGVAARMRTMRLDEAARDEQDSFLEPAFVGGDRHNMRHVAASHPRYAVDQEEQAEYGRQSARPKRWPQEDAADRRFNETAWIHEPSSHEGRLSHRQRERYKSHDEAEVFLVPVTQSPAKTPHRHTRQPIAPRGVMEQGGTVADSAKEVQYTRRRSLAGADHLRGGAVGDHVANEVEERTRRSHNDRYVWRPNDSFANSKSVLSARTCTAVASAAILYAKLLLRSCAKIEHASLPFVAAVCRDVFLFPMTLFIASPHQTDHSLNHTLTHSYSLTHTHSLTRTHTLTRSHTLSLSLYLPPPSSLSSTSLYFTFSSFTPQGSPLPDPGRSEHDAARTPNRRYDARPSPALRHSGTLSYERQVQRPPSAHRPHDNLETSAVIARAPPYRPTLRMFHEADHLEASGFRPREPEFERVDRPTSRGAPPPADTWCLSPSSRKSSSLNSLSTPTSSPARSRILSFSGAHIYADDAANAHSSSPFPASPRTPAVASHYGAVPGARTSRRPPDALQFSGAVISSTAPTTPQDADVEAFHRHMQAQHRGSERHDTADDEDGEGNDQDERRARDLEISLASRRQEQPHPHHQRWEQRTPSRQQQQRQQHVPPSPSPQRARSANRPRDNLAFSGGVTRKTSRLFDLLPQ